VSAPGPLASRRRRTFVLIFLLAVLAGFSTRLQAPAPMSHDVVIFIPGLYGSALRERDGGALRWPSMQEIMLRRRPLSVCPGGDAAATDCEALVAGPVVGKVAVLPWLYEVDVYADTLAGIESALGESARVRTFSYDWRLELSSQAGALDRMVEEERSKGNRVSLVAHSMGGLVASYYLRYGTQPMAQAREDWSGANKLDKVVLAGVPYGGSVMSFVDLEVGRTVALNAQILGASAYQSFPSTYQLLPDADDKILGADFKPLSAPLLDAATWRSQRWGAFKDGNSARGEDSLAQARRLKQLLREPGMLSPPASLQVLLIQGQGRKTLERVVLHGPGADGVVHDRKTWDAAFGKQASSRVLYGDGDAVVPLEASALPPGLATLDAQVLHTNKSHRQLLLDPAVVAQLAHFLGGEAPVAARVPARARR
jgi:pimeloyl-ACP methyl ester carboxylesterase